MAFKDRLKQAREKKNLTQKELAKLLDVTHGSIGNYESGVSQASVGVLVKIFEILEVEPNFLFQDEFKETEQIELTSEEKILIEHYRSLNSTGQSKLIENAEDLSVISKYQKIDLQSLSS